MGAIFLVLVGACLVILLQKGKCFNIFFQSVNKYRKTKASELARYSAMHFY